jgi:hypothetical protein
MMPKARMAETAPTINAGEVPVEQKTFMANGAAGTSCATMSPGHYAHGMATQAFRFWPNRSLRLRQKLQADDSMFRTKGYQS